MKTKIDFSRVETWLCLSFIFFFLLFVCSMKILGASELPKQFVEKDGYCKIKYGDDWDYKEDSLVCQRGLETQPFLSEDFKEVCPDHKIFSKGFNSKCFKEGKN